MSKCIPEIETQKNFNPLKAYDDRVRNILSLEENGKIVTGQSADTDTVVASAKAYVNALNKLLVRREKTAPN